MLYFFFKNNHLRYEKEVFISYHRDVICYNKGIIDNESWDVAIDYNIITQKEIRY
jgi:hypothetical protein